MKATKNERRAIRELVLESASLSILVLSVAVIFNSDWALIKSSLIDVGSVSALIAVCFSCFSIPLTAATYFVSKVVLIYEPSIKQLPDILEKVESAGISFGVVGFVSFLFSKSWIFALLFFIGIIISLLLLNSVMKELK